MVKHRKIVLTVLICCYNAGKFLDRCLGSLVKQSIPSSFYKILFINDASTDESLKIAESYKMDLKNLSLLNNKRNMGLVQSCNKALDNIDTSFFMRLDADDYLSLNALDKIEEELKYLEKEDFIIFQRWDVDNNKALSFKVTNDMYTWIAVGTVFNKDAVISVGGYSKEYWEEYDLYIRLLERGFKYKVSPSRIYYYSRGHGSMTAGCQKNKLGLKNLSRKWGTGILRKYGDFKKLSEYYAMR